LTRGYSSRLFEDDYSKHNQKQKHSRVAPPAGSTHPTNHQTPPIPPQTKKHATAAFLVPVKWGGGDGKGERIEHGGIRGTRRRGTLKKEEEEEKDWARAREEHGLGWAEVSSKALTNLGCLAVLLTCEANLHCVDTLQVFVCCMCVAVSCASFVCCMCVAVCVAMCAAVCVAACVAVCCCIVRRIITAPTHCRSLCVACCCSVLLHCALQHVLQCAVAVCINAMQGCGYIRIEWIICRSYGRQINLLFFWS